MFERLFKHIRLTDFKKELDTLTVTQDLVEDSNLFFNLMDEVTEGKAFREAIKFSSKSGRAQIDAPKWTERY